MTFRQSEQVRHDQVNLIGLLNRIEKTVTSAGWQEEDTRQPAWVNTQGMLQKLKYAKKLLRNIELNAHFSDTSSRQRYQDFNKVIDRLEFSVLEVDKRVTPKPVLPSPVLPTLPLPISFAPAAMQGVIQPKSDDDTPPLLIASSNGTATHPAQDLLLSPSDTATLPPIKPIDPNSALLPPNPPLQAETTRATASGTPAFLQNSAALQEEMSEQLAKMATQLKRNALHFADSLEKDKAVVLGAQEKMERNFDVMTKERVRLRDHRSKSWGTTWIVVLSLFIAAIGFVMTFFVIRLT
ncbi:hypothetical protein EW026_g4224 [Hermanssonia centrifuga]|uniref:USE1-like protein n=1 Tax=Hermanssonia centrifuga TaxID=98765 RepID=A0A4S4KIY8_9APHY|nr:hypothetical protein EW026_g4224 [Hermanssonia centrifuga]